MSTHQFFVDVDGYDEPTVFAVIDGDEDYPQPVMDRNAGQTARIREAHAALFERVVAVAIPADQDLRGKSEQAKDAAREARRASLASADAPGYDVDAARWFSNREAVQS